MEPVKNRAKLPCKHKFCYDCIKQNQEYNNKCPNCRQKYYKYKHKKKTKYVDLTKNIKDCIYTMTYRYIVNSSYRLYIDCMYHIGGIHKLRFLIIKDTIQMLLSFEDCREREFLQLIFDSMINIVRINTRSSL